MKPWDRNQSIIVWSMNTKPFVLSLSKHERLSDAPFDKLRVNDDRPTEENWDWRRFSHGYVFPIMDSSIRNTMCIDEP
jgi:hypothetical protein